MQFHYQEMLDELKEVDSCVLLELSADRAQELDCYEEDS